MPSWINTRRKQYSYTLLGKTQWFLHRVIEYLAVVFQFIFFEILKRDVIGPVIYLFQTVRNSKLGKPFFDKLENSQIVRSTSNKLDEIASHPESGYYSAIAVCFNLLLLAMESSPLLSDSFYCPLLQSTFDMVSTAIFHLLSLSYSLVLDDSQFHLVDRGHDIWLCLEHFDFSLQCHLHNHLPYPFPVLRGGLYPQNCQRFHLGCQRLGFGH